MCATWKWICAGAFLAVFTLAPILDSGAENPPDSITLDSIAKLYEGVVFDHAMHVGVADSCATCHHHGTGAPVQDENCARCHSGSEKKAIVACQECHSSQPFSAASVNLKEKDIKRYHRDKPGLKGAYHQNCLGCHEEMGGPTGCEDCHPRTDAGNAFFNAGPYAPKGGKSGAGHH